MARFMFRAAMMIVVSIWMLNSAEAQLYPRTGYGASQRSFARPPRFAQPVRHGLARPAAGSFRAQRTAAPARLRQPTAAQPVRLAAEQNKPQQARRASEPKHARSAYPYLNAPLYSSPVQHVPHQTGGTVITNQAFSPQEMLYPHRYKALYPPFYYKVSGHWFVTPGGVWSDEQWKLMGTEVKIKYSPRISLFSGFIPPATW